MLKNSLVRSALPPVLASSVSISLTAALFVGPLDALSSDTCDEDGKRRSYTHLGCFVCDDESVFRCMLGFSKTQKERAHLSTTQSK